MKVTKAQGKVEEFLPEKIVVAVVKSGGSPVVAREIAREVEQGFKGRDSVASSEIKSEVLKRLKSKDPNAYASWLEFDKKRGKK